MAAFLLKRGHLDRCLIAMKLEDVDQRLLDEALERGFIRIHQHGNEGGEITQSGQPGGCGLNRQVTLGLGPEINAESISAEHDDVACLLLLGDAADFDAGLFGMGKHGPSFEG